MYLNNPLSSTLYDIIIIGGGINGAAIARDCALRGLKVVLFEKNDYACGASSKSSKLIHGGLRYLEQYSFRLVKESLKERSILLKMAPHQVKTLPFVIPVYKNLTHPLWKIKMGLWLYDKLSPPDIGKHQNLKKEDIINLFPNLTQKNLIGGCFYYDAQMLDNRLVFSNLQSAQKEGATLFNHSSVIDLFTVKDKIQGVYYLSSNTLEKKLCRGKIVINCTGAWANEINRMQSENLKPLVSPTKGIHLVIPCIHPTHALTLLTPQDSRVFFMIPWNGETLLGTTDTLFEGNANILTTTTEEIHYLLEAAHYYFPPIKIDKSSVLASFAGLRPLISNSLEDPSSLPREHRIDISPKGLISVTGGKYTTYRSIAKEVVDKMMFILGYVKPKFTICYTDCLPLYDIKDKELIYNENNCRELIAQKYSLTNAQIDHLITHYGSNIHLILKILQETPSEIQSLCTFHAHLCAELTYAVRYEQVHSLEDWFFRRTQIAFTACKGIHCLNVTAKQLGKLLGWEPAALHRKCEEYLILVK